MREEKRYALSSSSFKGFIGIIVGRDCSRSSLKIFGTRNEDIRVTFENLDLPKKLNQQLFI